MLDTIHAQKDLTLTLLSAELLKDMAICYYRERQINEEAYFRSLLAKGRNGKIGAVCATLALEADANHPGITGPVLDWTAPIIVIVQNDVNRGPAGTQREADWWGQAVLDVAHFAADSGFGTFQARGKIGFVNGPIKTSPGCTQWRANLAVSAGRNTQTPRCLVPQVTITNGMATLTCATPNSEIYFTLDGSMPANLRWCSGTDILPTSAALYAAPIPVASGQTLRCAAYGLPGSGNQKSCSRTIEVP